MPESIIAMLAAASLGATWSSCSPDFSIKGVLDRFGQIKPRVLFTANGYSFKGKKIDSLERIANILKELPSIEKVVVVPYTDQEADIGKIANAVHYRDFRLSETGLQIEGFQFTYDEIKTDLQLASISGGTDLNGYFEQSGIPGFLRRHQRAAGVLIKWLSFE